MRKIFRVFLMAALIITLIGMWPRFASVATESVTAARVETAAAAQPSRSATSQPEPMSESRKPLPDQYPESDFRVLVGDAGTAIVAYGTLLATRGLAVFGALIISTLLAMLVSGAIAASADTPGGAP